MSQDPGNQWVVCQTPRTWTIPEEKQFERALVNISEDVPCRWEKITGMIPDRTVEEVKAHYDELVRDVMDIESGRVQLPEYSEDWVIGRRGMPPVKVKNEGRKGKPWTEQEHRTILKSLLDLLKKQPVEESLKNLEQIALINFLLFLYGLQKYGKGDWRSISRNVVVTKTSTQVASHAQKYFMRKTGDKNKGRKRSSIHDITTPTDAHLLPPASISPDQVGYHTFNPTPQM